MAGQDSDPDEAMTQEELLTSASNPKPRNAFTELMAPNPKPEPKTPVDAVARDRRASKIRDGLGVYLDDPSSFPASRVIYYNDDFVAIHDLYPKSTIHALLLPRSPRHTMLHPFEAFENREFLASVQKETLKLKDLVAKELQRKFGRESKADALREAVLNGDVEPETMAGGGRNGDGLPPGRDWAAEVKTGVHAHPSMNHLHVHVLSRDMRSPALKHRNHYNSFNTPFLVDVADFPLGEDDPRQHPGREGYMKKDFKCWRCGKSFKNQFQQLKQHLELEFDTWTRE